MKTGLMVYTGLALMLLVGASLAGNKFSKAYAQTPVTNGTACWTFMANTNIISTADPGFYDQNDCQIVAAQVEAWPTRPKVTSCWDVCAGTFPVLPAPVATPVVVKK